MGSTFKSPGNTLTFTAPAGGVVKGEVYVIGGVPCIAADSADADAEFEGHVTGVHSLDKASGTAWSEGQAVYWDAANTRCAVDPLVGPCIGAVAAAAASGDTTGKVRLNAFGLLGKGVYNVRRRCTVAEVNAGVTLVPALVGAKIRMIAATAIAVGGAASGVTTVDILGTASASSRKLVAFAQASLTQSTVLKDGGSGATVLADGASYTANDVNTAVTVGKTGADVATATHIDISFSYALDN